MTCPESQMMPIPANLDFTQAAAIPEVWITAFQLLHTIGESEGLRTMVSENNAGSGMGMTGHRLFVYILHRQGLDPLLLMVAFQALTGFQTAVFVSR